jgi:hypothetical protein
MLCLLQVSQWCLHHLLLLLLLLLLPPGALPEPPWQQRASLAGPAGAAGAAAGEVPASCLSMLPLSLAVAAITPMSD